MLRAFLVSWPVLFSQRLETVCGVFQQCVLLFEWYGEVYWLYFSVNDRVAWSAWSIPGLSKRQSLCNNIGLFFSDRRKFKNLSGAPHLIEIYLFFICTSASLFFLLKRAAANFPVSFPAFSWVKRVGKREPPVLFQTVTRLNISCLDLWGHLHQI